MEEENSGTPRVTRARTRRLSVLDTDSRPMTPILDVPADRASPRPTRRARLSSVTVEVRTPVRTTRASVTRGETPEPATPKVTLSAAKRSTRTPAKAVRKQLALPEEIDEEQPQAAETQDEKPIAAQPAAVEIAAIDSPDDRRVTRSMSKSPPFKNTSKMQYDTTSSAENASQQQQTMESTEKNTETVDLSTIETKESLVANDPISSSKEEQFVNSSTKEVKLESGAQTKVKVMVKDILSELKQVKDKPVQEPELSPVTNGEPSSEKEKLIEDKDKGQSPDANDHDSVDQPPKTDTDLEDPISDINSNAIKTKEAPEHIKAVGFTKHDTPDDTIKRKFPKTPARICTPVGEVRAIKERKSETPLKPITLKARNSSTPIAKVEPATSQEEIATDLNPPPLQIDQIKPLEAEIEKTPEHVERKQNVSSHRIVSEDDDDDDGDDHDEDDEAEEHGDSEVFGFIDNEAEVVHDYQSGDSMDSSERREIEENQVPDDGESVGSQDTVEDHSEDSADEKLSFIVSDNDEDDDNQNDDSEILGLCLSDGSEVEEDAPKKRRRIIVHDSTDEDEIKPEENKTAEANGDEIKSMEAQKEERENEMEAQKEERENEMEAKTGEKENEMEALEEESEIESPVKEDKIKESVRLPRKSILHVSVCESLQEKKSRKSDRLNSTAPTARLSMGRVKDKNKTLEVEEIFSSSNDEDEENTNKMSTSLRDKSIYEVVDSESDSNKSIEAIEMVTPEESDQQLSTPGENQEKNELENKLVSNDSAADDADKERESTELASKSVLPNSETLTFHTKEKQEDESTLLAEIAACNVSHLRQMFNPLQKTRRQTLFGQDLQASAVAPRPKLKRRSEQFDSDVKPSQSFIESLAEERRVKRKRLSKSFCGAVDVLETSMQVEVNRTSQVSSDSCEKSALDMEMEEAIEPIKEEKQMEPAPLVVDVAVKEELSPSTSELPQKELNRSNLVEEDSQIANNATESEKDAPTQDVVQKHQAAGNMAGGHIKEKENDKEEHPKSRDVYLEYCDNLIQAANEAKLEQKKQHRLMAVKKQREPAILKTQTEIGVVASSVVSAEKTVKIKKDVKRLRATKQAIKHAVQLLVPEAAKSEPKSLARKLSPQPTIESKSAKQQKKKKHAKLAQVQVSPVKSSDEENHHAPKRIKTSAGYVTVLPMKESKRIETFKISSGIVKVEPCTPTQKYFKEIPQSPIVQHGFRELPSTSKHCKKQPSSTRNPATEAALRFKREMFGRNVK